MIFLAISGLLLVSAIVAVGGEQAHTEFITSMNEVNTKMQSWIDDVVNGFSGSTATALASTYSCQLDPITSRPNLVAGANELGKNPDCIFLGKAIQVNSDVNNDSSGHMYVYTVLGRRATLVGGESQPVPDIVSANPTAAYFPGVADLTEDYQIPNGARVTSVDQGTHLGGFFTGFNDQSASNGSTALAAVQYPYNSNAGRNDSGVINCINNAGSSPCHTALPNLQPMSTWKICFASTRNNDTASLTITSTNGIGATTQLKVGKGTCP